MEIGKSAPEFTLYDSDKNKVNLSDFRGSNVVILFFPLAFTSVCTKELCSVNDGLGAFDQLNAKVLGISVDSLYTLARYREMYKIAFPLLSDFNKEVSASYNCLYEHFSYEMKGVSKRASFIVDPAGILQYAEILEHSAHLPDFDAINRTLRQLELTD